MSQFKVFSGTKSRYVAEEIAHDLGVELGKMNIQHFADGEFEVSFEESIRGAEVYLIQSTFPNCDNLMELLLMIDAAKRASAKSIAAKLVADLLSAAGIDRLITMDLHADQIQGFFNVPVDHLYASSVFIPYIESLELDNLVIASPDVGGAKRANNFAKYFNAPLVLCHKQRAKANVVETMTIIGDVQDKNVILLDDMVDTAGTICKAANLMVENGAKSVRAFASHAIMSDPASERVMDSKLTELVFSNSIPFDVEKCPKVTVLSVASLFADTITRVHDNRSISSQYLI